MNPRYPAVADRAGHRCEYCHAPEAVFNLPFEVEHIKPLAEAGTDEEGNLALACRSCNLYKSDYLSGFDKVTQNTVRLFHPRRDVWDDHFEVIKETGVIRGRTDVGRATLIRLRMNRQLQLNARLQWARLGLFP
jgi:hypothetical protein